MGGQEPVTFEVDTTPATFAIVGEEAWREAVELAAATAVAGLERMLGRLSVTIDFCAP